LDLERSESEIQSLQAAGGNSRAARRLRVKSQLRDKKGRWVEMGRGSSIDTKVKGKPTKIRGVFVGSDPKAPGERGLFLVKEDKKLGVKEGVYSFKGKAVTQILASLDPEYLEDQGIKDPVRDVNNNLIGKTLDADIENIEDVYREEVGELDEALATGKLSSDEVAQAFNERSRSGAYESYNVVATLEEADTEVLTEEELEAILEDVGVTPETKTEAPESKKMRSEISGDEIQDIKMASIAEALKAEGRFPIPRQTTLDNWGKTSDVTKGAKLDYAKVYEGMSSEDPEFGEKYPTFDSFWDRVYDLAVDERTQSPDKLNEEMKKINKGYAKYVMGLDPENGTFTVYRNAINNAFDERDAAVGYVSTNKNLAFDYNANTRVGEQANGRYEITVKPDEVNGMIGYSQVEDEYALTIGPNVTYQEGRVKKVGELETVKVAPWHEEAVGKLNRRQGATPFRGHSFVGQFDFLPISRNPLQGDSLQDFLDDNNMTMDDWKNKFDELHGEGAYQRNKDSGRENQVSLQSLQRMFVDLGDGTYGLDITRLSPAGNDSAGNASYGDFQNPSSYVNDYVDNKLKFLSLIQEITGEPFMVHKNSSRNKEVTLKPVAKEQVAELPAEQPEPAQDQTSILDDLSMSYDLKGYKQVSGPLGSNKGGIYENSTGKQIYVKEPKTDLHGDNEVLASALYELAGVPAVKVRNGKLADGTKVTFSEMVSESKADFRQKVNDPEYRKKVQEGFAIDAWLANWDVAGTGFDNIVSDANNEPVRVDPGGALLFRARGDAKGNAFNDKVTELDTLVDPSQNQWSATTFQDMSEEDKVESAKKLLDISDEDIDNYVNASITDEGARTKLSELLKARRQTILDRYSLSKEPVEDTRLIPKPGEGLPFEKKPVKATAFKTANRLEPGDVIKMPDGTTRKVVRNTSVDSGRLVSFEPRDGQRRGTYRTYEDNDLVEIEQPTPSSPTDSAEPQATDESRSFEQVKEAFENRSEEEKAKPTEQRRVQHWYVDEDSNIYLDRDDSPTPPANVISPESERFWDRDSNKVFDGNGNEILFTPTYDEKFIPIPKDGSGVPRPMGESGFWDRNQLGVDNVEDSPVFVQTDDPQEIVNALARGKFVKTETLEAAYNAIKLAITAKYAPRAGEVPSKEERDSLKQALSLVNSGQRYQLNRAIDVDSLNKKDTTTLERELRRATSASGTISPESMATLHEAFRNQPIDLTNLQANGSTAYSQNNAGAIREEMPPLAGINRPIFEKDLERLGINYTNEMMQADDMKPTQAEISMDSVSEILKRLEENENIFSDRNSRIYVDRDGNILDGHHRWAAVIALQWKDGEKKEIPVTRLDLARDEALALMNEWTNSRGIPGQKLVDNRKIIVAQRLAPAPVESEASFPASQHNEEKVREVLREIAELTSDKRTYPGLDTEGFITQDTEDPDVKEAIDMAYYMSDIIERSGSDDKDFLYEQLVSTIKRNQTDKATLRAGERPKISGKADTVRKITARKEGTTIDPINMSQPRTGIAVAVQGTNEEVADALFFNMYLGDLIVADYVDRNKSKFKEGFKLGTWHDEDNNEVTFDIVEVFPQGRIEEAELAGQQRNQQAIFDLKNKEPIGTGGTGDRGRARKQREAQRAQQQGSDGRGAGPELGQPEPIGEGREGQVPTPGDAEADGSDREQLTIDRQSEDLLNVPASRRGDIDYGELSFDMASLNARQRQILKKVEFAKKGVFKNITKAARAGDLENFERNMTWGQSLKDTFNRVFGELKQGNLLRFGQGEKERLKNMTFFSNTQQLIDNRITYIEGVYVAKNGEPYSLKFANNRAGIHKILPDGRIGDEVAFVSLSGGEYSRGTNDDEHVSISYLSSSDGGRGLGAVAVTFARYIVESGGRKFAHSYNLSNQGANNSKLIEPGDPSRHHFSQSEKVLQVMGAPTTELLKNLGWFTGNYQIYTGESSPVTLSPSFLKRLDPSLRSNNTMQNMIGPIHRLDKGLNHVLETYKKQVTHVRDNLGETVEVPDFAEALMNQLGYAKAFENYRLQFVMEELNWQDGPSKKSVIKKLKDTEEFLDHADEFFKNLTIERRSGYLDWTAGIQVGTLKKNISSIREGLEADADFDSRRVPRPERLDRGLVKTIELKLPPKMYLSRKKEVEPFAGISTAFDLEKFDGETSLRGAYAALVRSNYGATLGDSNIKPPAGWTRTPGILAQRFTVEQLRQSLEESLQRTALTVSSVQEGDGSTNIPRNFYAELDFRREFSPQEEIGLVPIVSVAQALYTKSIEEGGFEFREYLAEQVDKAYGIQTNIERIDSEKEDNSEFFKKMDEYLKSIGESREKSTEGKIDELQVVDAQGDIISVVKTSYDKEDGILRSEGKVRDKLYSEQIEEFTSGGRLIDNELFDELPNNLGELLIKTAPQYGQADEFNPDVTPPTEAIISTINLNTDTSSAKTIAARYRTEDLIEAFTDATIRGNPSIKMEIRHQSFNDREPVTREVKVDIRALRNVLQILNVDTNELIRTKVLPNLSNSPETSPPELEELNRRGLGEPRSVSEIIANANEVVDITGLVRQKTYGNGASKPELMKDTNTGKQYVVKRYENPLLAEMEITAQALYRAAGINASNPRFGRKFNDSDEYFVVTDHVESPEGTSYRGLIAGQEIDPSGELRPGAKEAVLNGLPMDILLDNIDGPYNSGNILYTNNGGYIRIDGGGALLSDPLDRIDDKRTSRRYNAMSPQGWDGEATEEQERVLEIAKRDGSFEGEGIEFTYDLYLNPSGWHWNWEGGLRRDILENFDEEAFKQRVRDTILPLTPDKITELVDGMPITSDSSYKPRIKEALIYRRAHMLNKFGIEDTYNPQDRELASTPADDSDRERLGKYVQDAFKNEDSVERDDAERTVSNPKTTKQQIEDSIEELRPLIPEKPENEASKGSYNEVVEILNTSEEKPESDDLSVDQPDDFTTNFIDLADSKPGDIITDFLITTHNGRVIFNVKLEDNTYKIGIRNERGELTVFDHDPATLRHMRYVNRYASESKIPPETDFDPSMLEARKRFLSNINRRGNKVLQEVKVKYVNHTVLSNGDLLIASRNFKTAGGRSYKYQVVVHRKADEEFVAYVREWEVDSSGAAIGPVRVNKMSNPTHSPKALLNKIQPLIKGPGIGQGVYGKNPRNWFNQGNSIEAEVTDPRTGMPIPNSLSVQPNVQYIEDTGIRSTGDPTKDALISYVGGLVSRGVQATDIYRRLASNGVLSRSKILDIIERVESNRAFPGINQIPYLSRNQRDIVRVGDRVRHYSPNGTIKEGVVRLRRPLSVNRKPNGDYNYTDVLVVKFDDRDQGTPIVAKNLEVISRSDGESPGLGGELPLELPRDFTPEMLSETFPAHWSAKLLDIGRGKVEFVGPSDAPLITITSLNDPFGRERFIVNKYPSKDAGRNSRSTPEATYRFANLPSAVVTAENIIGSYEESKAEKNETPVPDTNPDKLFQNSEGETNLESLAEAFRKNVSESGCALTASVESCSATQGIRLEEMESETFLDDNGKPVGKYLKVFWDKMPKVNKKYVPTYWILKTKAGGEGNRAKKLVYWTNSSDEGDKKKAKYLNIFDGATFTEDQAAERVRIDAEMRIDFLSGILEDKPTRTLTINLGQGKSFTEEIDFETWKELSISPISKAHFTLGDDGTIKISEARQDFYEKELALHLSDVTKPSGKPTMFVLGGAPASGKGGFTEKDSKLDKASKINKNPDDPETPTVKKFNPLTGIDETTGEVSAVLVDPDVFKLRFPEVRVNHLNQLYDRVKLMFKRKNKLRPASDENRWANNSHEESSLMAKMVTSFALESGVNVVLDGVNAERTKTEKKVLKAKDKGYKVIGRYLAADIDNTAPDAAERGFITGREVPVAVQIASAESLMEALNDSDALDDKGNPKSKIWEIFDDFQLLHRDKYFNFTPIGKWTRGQEGAGLEFFKKPVTGKDNFGKEVAGGFPFDIWKQYVDIVAEMTPEQRTRKLNGIKKEMKLKQKLALERLKTIRGNGEINAIEKEVMGLWSYLSRTYPEYSDAQLDRVWRRLVSELSTGKISDKTFSELINSARLDFLEIEKLEDAQRKFESTISN
jgi:hypothetical protein